MWYKKRFHKGRYKDMRKHLAKLDWNNTLENKTATECWNILKVEIDCIVEQFVPLKKQGKRSKKKYLSKEAIRKIKYKPHQRLLLKLMAHGIGNGMINWIKKWLIDRRQTVVVDGDVSNWKSVLSGVPQGSVL